MYIYFIFAFKRVETISNSNIDKLKLVGHPALVVIKLVLVLEKSIKYYFVLDWTILQCRCKNSYTKVRTDIALFSLFGLSCKIHVRENRRGNQEWTTQRNYQHNVHKTKTISTTKTTQYVLDTTLRKTYTNKVNKTWAFLQTIRDKDEPNIVDITTIFRTIDFLTDIAFRF
jgi:hypothetical protein